MAMCPSGSLSICATAGACRSISTAVGTGSGSLAALSVSAGKGAPHAMTEFYSYSADIPVNFVQYGAIGNMGISNYVCRSFCVVPKATSPTTYTICFSMSMGTVFQASGAYSRVCITCNASSVFCCCIPFQDCAVPTFNELIDTNDCVRVLVTTCTPNVGCTLNSCARICIQGVSAGYTPGTTCCAGCACTG